MRKGLSRAKVEKIISDLTTENGYICKSELIKRISRLKIEDIPSERINNLSEIRTNLINFINNPNKFPEVELYPPEYSYKEVDKKGLCHILGISYPTYYRWVREFEFMKKAHRGVDFYDLGILLDELNKIAIDKKIKTYKEVKKTKDALDMTTLQIK